MTIETRSDNDTSTTRQVHDADEFTQPVPENVAAATWADTFWVDVNDPSAGICAVAHWHIGHAGVSRVQFNAVIDGTLLNYVNKFALDVAPGLSAWSDGRVSYTVVEPHHHIRVAFDGPRFAVELDYVRRFPFQPVFRPLLAMGAQTVDGGHYEQPMRCTGRIEVRDGPNRGAIREIDCSAFRDHSWSDRWSKPMPWDGYSGAERYGHYWPALYFSDRHIQGWGMHTRDPTISGTVCGGFVTTATEQGLLLDSSVEYVASPDDWRDVEMFRYTLTMPDGEIVHVRSDRSFGRARTYHLDLFNDVEARVDQHARFCEITVEETGERGLGTLEYSVVPATNRWLT